MNPKYKRILLKLSGEALAGEKKYGIDSTITSQIVDEIKEVHEAGVQIGIVIGGGNIFRGLAASQGGFDRSTGDDIGMLATLINSLTLKNYLEHVGIDTAVLNAFSVDKVSELFTRKRALDHLKNGRIIIIAGGTGNPYFTTDTAAALRCAEIDAEVILKATKVDGVYDSDPMKNPAAKKFNTITYSEALARNLKVMDATALSLCMENETPIIVFELLQKGNLRKCVEGIPVGSIVNKGA